MHMHLIEAEQTALSLRHRTQLLAPARPLAARVEDTIEIKAPCFVRRIYYFAAN